MITAYSDDHRLHEGKAEGVTVRAKKIGLYTEVKSFSSEPEDDFGDDIDVSGTGFFSGISFHF